MRAISAATVSFGLVSIPVKMYSSYESGVAIRFNQIHSKDGSRLKQQLISAKTGELVPKDEIVKGYEFAKGQYVLFSPQELKALEEDNSHTIDIEEFVPANEVDRIYLEKIYFLGPDKGGARAYRLLAQALDKSGKAALAKYADRGKQYLVLVRPMEDGLVMEQLHYAEELRSFSEVPIDDATVKPAELELALQLIEQAASEEFAPEKYHDEVRARILDLIERKVEGEDISVSPSEEPERKIIDMMEALKASIAAGDNAKPAKRASKKTPARKKRTAQAK